MNARVYDPDIGKFLSADPTVQDLYDPQSFNRYSYVENNPLALTDPSGYEPWATASDGTRTQYSDSGNGTVSNS